jgi:hypothetical protein
MTIGPPPDPLGIPATCQSESFSIHASEPMQLLEDDFVPQYVVPDDAGRQLYMTVTVEQQVGTDIIQFGEPVGINRLILEP